MSSRPKMVDIPDAAAVGPARVDLFELLSEIVRNTGKILLTCLVAAVITSIIVLLIPNKYTGRTRLLPPQQNQSVATMMLGQLGPLAGLAGKDLNIKNMNDVYVAMLKSRTLAESMVKDFDLQKRYKAEKIQDAVERLEKNTRVALNRDNTIDVEVSDRDPALAAKMANAYVDGLMRISRTLAVTEASRRRLFFESQLKSVRDDLALAESELRRVQERTGLIEPNTQARTIVMAVADLRAQIAAREVQLSSMRTFATENNPDYIQLSREISALRDQLARLQKDKNLGEGDTQIATKSVPEVGLEFVRKLRDVKYNETLYEVLSKQYEIARIDEAKDAAVVQVLDPAVLPERKSSPQRTLIVLLVTIVTFIFAVLFFAGRYLLFAGPMGDNRRLRLRQLRSELANGLRMPVRSNA